MVKFWRARLNFQLTSSHLLTGFQNYYRYSATGWRVRLNLIYRLTTRQEGERCLRLDLHLEFELAARQLGSSRLRIRTYYRYQVINLYPGVKGLVQLGVGAPALVWLPHDLSPSLQLLCMKTSDRPASSRNHLHRDLV